MLRPEIIELFRTAPSPTLVLTVGNTLRGDDGVGPFIASLATTPREGFVVLDAGERPESAVDQAIATRPARVLIIDAANFRGEPGEARIIPAKALDCVTLSTHRFPLAALSAIITEDTLAPVFFIGIQPAITELGEGLSEPVHRAALEIAALVGMQTNGRPAGKEYREK